MTLPQNAPNLIETMRAEQGVVPLLDWHMARLQASATALGYARPNAALLARVQTEAEALGDIDAGAHRLRLLWSADGTATLTAAALPALAPDPQVQWASTTLDSNAPLLRHKTTHRPWYAADTEWLTAHPDVFDLLYLNEREELCEGTRSNVYVEIDGAWLTPAVASGCLPGVQRGALMAEGRVKEATITPALLERATRLRLSNALRGWFDVRLT
ncbi:aminotransferase class IV [Schauerella aestuarii]|uniref:aminotransferase class IV n=1 Tax=Schauerella aestuarii TaxID=2511204 RepID=UPI001369F8A6|nr:aminotransferase class IV [Achromobacter aestuarii]MYZ42912.1 aminotransferase [Achromobacter aestuarii]